MQLPYVFRLILSFGVGIVILLLITPQAVFIRFAQSLADLLSSSSYYTVTAKQLQMMKDDPDFCVQNDDCTSLCAPFTHPDAILTNKYFPDTTAGIQLEHTCPRILSTVTNSSDRLICQDHACVTKSFPINPQKLRGFIAFISRITRPEVQLPYEE